VPHFSTNKPSPVGAEGDRSLFLCDPRIYKSLATLA
jgi:hypothetical protein